MAKFVFSQVVSQVGSTSEMREVEVEVWFLYLWRTVRIVVSVSQPLGSLVEVMSSALVATENGGGRVDICFGGWVLMVCGYWDKFCWTIRFILRFTEGLGC